MQVCFSDMFCSCCPIRYSFHTSLLRYEWPLWGGAAKLRSVPRFSNGGAEWKVWWRGNRSKLCLLRTCCFPLTPERQIPKQYFCLTFDYYSIRQPSYFGLRIRNVWFQKGTSDVIADLESKRHFGSYMIFIDQNWYFYVESRVLRYFCQPRTYVYFGLDRIIAHGNINFGHENPKMTRWQSQQKWKFAIWDFTKKEWN